MLSFKFIAFEKWLKEEIEKLEKNEKYRLKVSDKLFKALGEDLGYDESLADVKLLILKEIWNKFCKMTPEKIKEEVLKKILVKMVEEGKKVLSEWEKGHYETVKDLLIEHEKRIFEIFKKEIQNYDDGSKWCKK